MKHISKEVINKYLKLLPIQILGIVVSATNALIDSIITGRYIGSEALGAIGLFAPIISAVGFFMILITGFEILCSTALGEEDKEKSSSLFSTCIFIAGLLCILTTLICVVFRFPLSRLLGADPATEVLLADYILGYSPGFIGDVLMAIMMIFLPLNGDTKRSYVGIAALIVSNVALDLITVIFFDMGVFGMGLASSVSYILSALLLVPGFINTEKMLRIDFKLLSFKPVAEAVKLGSPNLMFTLGTVIKAYVLNWALMKSFGVSAIATANVQNSLCSFLGAVPQGCGGTFLVLGSLYFGSRDKKTFSEAFKFAMEIGIILSAFLAILLMAGSYLISSFYFDKSDPAFLMTRDMLLIFPSFLVFNTVLTILLRVYQCQKRITLVNILSIAENLMIAALAVILISIMGINGAWYAFPICEIICILWVAIDIRLNANKGDDPVKEWISFGPVSDQRRSL